MPYDILQGIKYDPRRDDQNFALLAQGLDEANKRYDTAESSIGDALAAYGSIPAVNPDRPILAKRLETFNKDIGEMVNKKYNGDYGAAAKEISRRIKQEQPYFAQAKQTQEAYKQALPMYQKLMAEGKLVTKKGVTNPLEVGSFGANGEIIGTPQYEMYERGDYEDWIAKNYSRAFQEETEDIAPKFTGQSPYAIAQKLKGLSDETIAKRITDVDAKKFIEDNKVFAIEHGLDINKPEDLKVAKDYLTKTAQSQVATQIDNQYLSDPGYIDALEQARIRKMQESQAQTNQPKLNRLYSTSVIGDKEDVTSVPLSDATFKGQMKRDLLKSRWKDAEGRTNPKAFEQELAQFEKQLSGTMGQGAKKVNLKDFIVRDSFGTTDVDATLMKLEELATKPLVLPVSEQMAGAGPDPEIASKMDLARAFKGKLDAYLKTKSKDLFGDYGTDVMGFDLTDKNSAQTYTQMGDYINQISPDVFNFETGKFSDKKTNKLSKNKEFLEARKDNKFKIQGVIKGADGNIKYIAEDGSGEPQVVSSNNEDVNRNLLRMFGSPDLIANFEYKNFKLTPSGNTVVYKDVNSNDEKKYKLKSGYKVERTSAGKYNLKNSEGKVFKENGVPKEFDKWEIIHNIGLEEEK